MEELRRNQVHGQLYSHWTQTQRRPRGPRVIGKLQKERLSLECVVLDQVLCSQHCLHDIQANDILMLQCLSLGSPKYKRRSTWVIDTLQDSIVSTHSS